MCIIVYKKAGAKMPEKATLKQCFEHNPDGAGYMFNLGGQVFIRKGFQTFKAFWDSLSSIVEKYGENPAFVLHFRISTQAGTRQDCTHPFPLSDKMEDLRKLRTNCNIGIAHNGIISLTSSSYVKTITYSDTMKFITDYLTLIIKDKEYYKNADTVKLITRLADSRLAILDGDGTCNLIGSGWIEDGGIWYSNTSYKAPKYVGKYYGAYYDYLEDEEDSDKYDIYIRHDGYYHFPSGYCPFYVEGDTSYCCACADCDKCGISDYYGADCVDSEAEEDEENEGGKCG